MNFSKALDATFDHFGITARWIANKSGVTPQMISSFRRGHQGINTHSLEKILSALPREAQLYFYESLYGQGIQARCPGALELIEEMEPLELAATLNAIADRLARQRKEQKVTV